jgi:hypothetical protein
LNNGIVGEGDLKTVVENLILKNSDGYSYLELANKADYVQRDALYFGTVKIDLSPKHIYSGISKYDPSFGINEKQLIETNLKYLSERFYNNDEVIWFSRLLEKVIASILLSENFNLSWLDSYNDSQFERLICQKRDKNNNHVNISRNWTKRAKKIINKRIKFGKVFGLEDKFDPVPIGGDVIDAEYGVVGKRESKRGLLEYPFKDGVLVTLDYAEGTYNTMLADSGEGENRYQVRVFQDVDQRRIKPLLKILHNLSPHLSFSHVAEVRSGLGQLLSSTGTVRYDNTYGLSDSVVNSLARVLESMWDDDEADLGSLFSEFRNGLKTYDSVWRSAENSIWLMTDGNYLGAPNPTGSTNRFRGVVTGLLSLPIRLLQYSKPKNFLRRVKETALQFVRDGENDPKRGDIFEAACLLDRILDQRSEFQFFLNGLIEVDPNSPRANRDVNEHDIIELRYKETGDCEIVIYACTISENYKSKDRSSLSNIGTHIHDNVFEGVKISTRHMVPKDMEQDEWNPEIEDAGTNFH